MNATRAFKRLPDDLDQSPAGKGSALRDWIHGGKILRNRLQLLALTRVYGRTNLSLGVQLPTSGMVDLVSALLFRLSVRPPHAPGERMSARTCAGFLFSCFINRKEPDA
jgi:hypothetical protein